MQIVNEGNDAVAPNNDRSVMSIVQKFAFEKTRIIPYQEFQQALGLDSGRQVEEVLISVIYPSRVAANIAIPDVNRSWKMPDPKQSRIEITLPFLVKREEQNSLGGFLLSHFTGHQDVSHGLFSTGEIAFRFDTNGSNGLPAETPEDSAPACFQLSSRVWLAPFDFGIMQHVEILFCPAEDDAGFLEIHIRLTRQSGEVNAWGRINKSFVNDLRKQLLIWRSMDGWTLAHYEKILETAAASTAA